MTHLGPATSTNAGTFVAPVLPIRRLTQLQLFFRSIRWRKSEEDVAVRSLFWRRALWYSVSYSKGMNPTPGSWAHGWEILYDLLRARISVRRMCI